MLHIVLMILKIIGIILLAILGLLLGILFLVLLVPLRYRVRGSYYGDLKGGVKVTWLLHIISLSGAYQDGQADLTVRLFGVRLFKQKENIDLTEAVKDAGADIQKGVSEVETMESEELLQVQEVKPEISQNRERLKDPKVMETEEETKDIPPQPDAAKQSGEKTEKPSRLARFLLKGKSRFRHIADRVRGILENWEKLKDFITNEENKKTFALILRQTKRLARHMLPGRIRGQVTFGFDDPYYTGQVLSFASVLYPYYYKSLKIYPVFDQVKLEGEIDLKGRIRMATVLVLLVRVYFDKNFRTLLKRFR